MSAVLKTKLRVANDRPELGASSRVSKVPPRVLPLTTLRPPKKKTAKWLMSCAAVLLFTSLGGVFWYASNVLEVLKAPALEPGMARPDPEDGPAYAETIMPPPNGVVAPIPRALRLHRAGAVAVLTPDPHAGLAASVSQLQAPPELAKLDPAISVIADKIKDTPAIAVFHTNGNTPHIALQNSHRPAMEDLLDRAGAKLEAGDDKGALKLYDRVLANDRDNREALIGKAEVLANMKQYEDSATVYRRLLALNPKDETARIELVSALGVWGSPAASHELQRIVGMHPKFAAGQAALAQALVKQNSATAALPHARRAAQIEPNNILYRLNLAIAYDRLGRSGKAVGFYRDVLKICSNNRALDLPISPLEISQRVDYLERKIAQEGTSMAENVKN